MKSHRVHFRNAAGFTLIELMTVIIVVAVLLAIALPAYRDQVIRGHRAAAKADMLELANRQEQFLLSNRSYAGSAGDLNFTASDDVQDHYIVPFDISTASASGLPFFTITATPKGSQANDGQLTLNSEGLKTPEDKWAR